MLMSDRSDVRLLKGRRFGVALILMTLFGCGSADDGGEASEAGTETPESGVGALTGTVTPLFVDATGDTGLAFRHYSGAQGAWHVPEILGSGVALLDYDSDGDLDVFFVQSNDRYQVVGKSALYPLPPGQSPGHRLFANRLNESGKLTFDDVTDAAGVGSDAYGMGVAVADYDNDGDPDIYVTNAGANEFYRNDQGVFVAIDNAAGAQDERWSTSASFCDVNNDSLPDLYVANYVYYGPDDRVVCRDSLGQQDYCGPQSYSGVPDALFINLGNGQFENRTALWGVDTAASTGLGVSCRDFDQNGTVDVYVANDAMPNLLWVNSSTQFEERGQLSGSAINVNGMSEGSMGIAVGDYDRDGDDDLFVTHWNNETNTLYRNDLELGFLDVTRLANLSGPSLSHTGFGTEWIDVDNDSNLDLFVTNGAVQRYVDGSGALSDNYGQPNQLFVQDGKGRFELRNDLGGDATRDALTGRGTAFGDIDNDGDMDVVVTNKDGPAKLYLNQYNEPLTANASRDHHWLGMELRGSTSLRDALGAVVTVKLPDGQACRQVVRTDGSYLSASDKRLLFGLADVAEPVDIEVRWPGGSSQTFSSLSVDQYHVLSESTP